MHTSTDLPFLRRPAQWRSPLLLFIFSVLIVAGATAATLVKQTIGSGLAIAANSRTTMRGTFGQPVAGNVTTRDARASQGFWNGGVAGAEPRSSGSLSPGSLTLFANAPNPFSCSTTLRFLLAQPADVVVSFFAEDGRVVWKQRFGNCTRGLNERSFSAGTLPAGTYRYTLSEGRTVLAGSMTITR